MFRLSKGHLIKCPPKILKETSVFSFLSHVWFSPMYTIDNSIPLPPFGTELRVKGDKINILRRFAPGDAD